MPQIETKIAGVFNLPEGKEAMKLLKPADTIHCEREPENAFDKNAVALYAQNQENVSVKIGYLKKEVAADMANKIIEKVEKMAGAFDAIIVHYSPKNATQQPDDVLGMLSGEELVILRAIQKRVHGVAKDAGWWNDPATGQPIKRNKGELLMLMVSELSEGMEGERKDLMDDHLPHRKMAEVELADTVIRIMDYAGGFGYDIAGAISEKLAYNVQRADHKPENRAQEGGKKF